MLRPWTEVLGLAEAVGENIVSKIVLSVLSTGRSALQRKPEQREEVCFYLHDQKAKRLE